MARWISIEFVASFASLCSVVVEQSSLREVLFVFFKDNSRIRNINSVSEPWTKASYKYLFQFG